MDLPRPCYYINPAFEATRRPIVFCAIESQVTMHVPHANRYLYANDDKGGMDKANLPRLRRVRLVSPHYRKGNVSPFIKVKPREEKGGGYSQLTDAPPVTLHPIWSFPSRDRGFMPLGPLACFVCPGWQALRGSVF